MSKPTYPHAWKPGHPPRGVVLERQGPALFDPLTATAHELQKMMISGTLKSTDLVEEYVRQIEKHNGYLRAVSEYAPSALKQAQELDAKRQRGEFLGPLHGIPVLINNTFDTEPSLEMRTTAGAVALLNTRPTRNAQVVDKLLAAGAVILGKATISELNDLKGGDHPYGWSAVDGQGQSPYIHGGFDSNDTIGGHTSPGGSSSGVCIAVSAGLAAIGVGAGTEASITFPAIRASLFSIRPTTNIVSVEGAVPCSKSFDTIGPIGKSVKDVADLLSALVEPNKTTVPEGGYVSAPAIYQSKTFRVGTLDPQIWNYPDYIVEPNLEATKQMNEIVLDAYSKIRDELTSVFHDNVPLPPVTGFKLEGEHSIDSIWAVEMVDALNDYLRTLPGSPVKSVEELVEWNIKHAEQALPEGYLSQDVLVEALYTKLTTDQIERLRKHYLAVGSYLDTTFQYYGIDIIVAPGDCFLTEYAMAKGYPIAAIPMSYLDYKSRPVGLQAIASAHREDLLIAFMSACENSISKRKPPSAFLEVCETIEGQAQLYILVKGAATEESVPRTEEYGIRQMAANDKRSAASFEAHDFEPRKRGKYTQVACNECKRRKLKCSGEDICKRCASNRVSCVYAIPRPTASEENYPENHQHQRNQYGICSRCLIQASPLSETNQNPSSPSRLESLESHMSAMQRQLDLMSHEIRILQRRSKPSQQHFRTTSRAHKPTDSRWASRAPISPSYVGPTSSEFGLNVPNDDQPDMDETETSDRVQPSSSNSPYVPPVAPEERRKRTDISRSNPLLSLDETDALRLVDIYDEAVGTMYPVVDLKSIREYIVDYYSQHSNDAAGHMSPPQSGNEDWWFSARDTEVLKLVLALGLISESPGQSELGNILAASAEDTFARTRTQVPEVDMKELIILTLVSLYHSCRDDDILAWRTIGLASRGAMQMGLHRCDTWLRTGGVFPGDLERSWAINLFWCIYVFDKEFSFETGLPFGMRDSDMDSSLPRPAEHHTYLECMISYCRVGGNIWDLMIGWGSIAKAVASDNESFLNFQIHQWQESIPSEFRLDDLQGDWAPTMRDARLATPRILLHLRANHMRILIYKQNLLSAQSIRNNFAGANVAVANAKNTIQALSTPSYVSAIYSQRPQPFDRFLFSALATLFLAMFHYPDYFVNVCRDSFSEALNALKRSSTRGRHSRRLRKVIKNLKRLGTSKSSTRPNFLATTNDAKQADAVDPKTAANAQPTNMDHSIYSLPPSLVNETTPDDYSDLTNFFEFAGDFFMDPQLGIRGEVDQTNSLPNEQLQNSLDVFHVEDETLTRLMMGLL